MEINSLNGQIINSRDVYIHDDIFESMIFHRDKKACTYRLLKFGL